MFLPQRKQVRSLFRSRSVGHCRLWSLQIILHPDLRAFFFALIIDLTQIMKESRDEKELRHVWTEWHNKCGSHVMKSSYQRFVELTNRAAKLNGTIQCHLEI